MTSLLQGAKQMQITLSVDPYGSVSWLRNTYSYLPLNWPMDFSPNDAPIDANMPHDSHSGQLFLITRSLLWYKAGHQATYKLQNRECARPCSWLSGEQDQVQADVQDYVDMSISCTINLPAWGNGWTMKTQLSHLLTCWPNAPTGWPASLANNDGSRGGQPLTAVPYSGQQQTSWRDRRDGWDAWYLWHHGSWWFMRCLDKQTWPLAVNASGKRSLALWWLDATLLPNCKLHALVFGPGLFFWVIHRNQN